MIAAKSEAIEQIAIKDVKDSPHKVKTHERKSKGNHEAIRALKGKKIKKCLVVSEATEIKGISAEIPTVSMTDNITVKNIKAKRNCLFLRLSRNRSLRSVLIIYSRSPDTMHIPA